MRHGCRDRIADRDPALSQRRGKPVYREEWERQEAPAHAGQADADTAHGYEYPDLYRRTFGEDYKPEPYIEATYKTIRNHKWYLEPRMVTVNDLYAFEPGVRLR
jgi:hypothetical protein